MILKYTSLLFYSTIKTSSRKPKNLPCCVHVNEAGQLVVALMWIGRAASHNMPKDLPYHATHDKLNLMSTHVWSPIILSSKENSDQAKLTKTLASQLRLEDDGQLLKRLCLVCHALSQASVSNGISAAINESV